METHEEWRPVVGYEGRYEASSLGRLRSLRFRGVMGMHIMKTTRNYAGYRVVTLGVDRKQHRLHCLVLEAFKGSRPHPDWDGCHGDGDKDNNTLANLRWDSKSGNIKDRRSYYGEHNPNYRHGLNINAR